MIKLLLVDDHEIVLSGIRKLLDSEGNMEVVCTASSGKAAVSAAIKMDIDIVVLDMSMPDMNGIEVMSEVMSVKPKLRFVVFSMHSDKRFVARALRAGAMGYVLKDCAAEELIKAINEVSRGRSFLSGKIAETVFDDYRSYLQGDSEDVYSKLSTREAEVLKLIAEGKSTKNIAELLNLSVKTIETYRGTLMTKLNLHSIAELTKFAIREGIISIE